MTAPIDLLARQLKTSRGGLLKLRAQSTIQILLLLAALAAVPGHFRPRRLQSEPRVRRGPGHYWRF